MISVFKREGQKYVNYYYYYLFSNTMFYLFIQTSVTHNFRSYVGASYNKSKSEKNPPDCNSHNLVKSEEDGLIRKYCKVFSIKLDNH